MIVTFTWVEIMFALPHKWWLIFLPSKLCSYAEAPWDKYKEQPTKCVMATFADSEL